jgi:type III restriction enzyme
MLELFQFQETAAGNIAVAVSEYMNAPAQATVNRKLHTAPFFHALSSLTGSGKTVMLAEAVSQIAETMPVKPVILWMSKGKVVVSQTFENLSPGGKYHHLLDGMAVDALGNYSPDVVAESDRALLYFATVGTFNQKDKESGTLLVYKSEVDTMESSVWGAIKLRLDGDGDRRPLIVVYDEAQNLSDQQTDLLMELEPEGFLLASATMKVPARIGQEIAMIRTAGYGDEYLVTQVNTSQVVEEHLVKDTISLQGYNTPMQEAVSEMHGELQEGVAEAEALGLTFRPKAIYVSQTNVVADNPNQTDSAKQPFGQRQAPPILIWRHLVETLGVEPASIAVYADLKTDKDYPLPDEFVLFKGKDKDYDAFTAGKYQHIIFNQTLQEGWDDPSVYFAYIDKSMNSKVQVTQVIGRVLRQPGARHYSSERLNSAHFFVRVDKNSVFNDTIEEVRKELESGPGGLRILVTNPGKEKPQDYKPKVDVSVPMTALDPSAASAKVMQLFVDFTDYRADKVNTKGTGSRRILKRKFIEDKKGSTDTQWEEYEHSSEASARWIFHQDVQRQYKAALGVVNLTEPKLNAIVGIGSSAQKAVGRLAKDVIDSYVQNVRLIQRKSNPYKVGVAMARPDEVVQYNNAVHEGYANLNGLERPFAEELDWTGLTWCRNPPRTGYGIPLVSVGPTDNFYPDFLIWTDERVVCVDTKGEHLIRETASRKLLSIKYSGVGPRLDVQFVSEGKYRNDLVKVDKDGYTYWGLGSDGTINAITFDDLDALVKRLTDDALS